MRDDLVTITASILLRQSGAMVTGYVCTMTSEPCEIASLFPCVELLSEAWREDFRALCQHIVEERFSVDGMRPQWVAPRVLTND